VKVALYSRVSRDDLNCENQNIVLKQWAAREGIPDADCQFFSESISTRKTRPVKEQVIKMFREGKIDTIAVVKLDRFARSLQEMVLDVEAVVNGNGRFVSISNGLDFSKKGYNASQQLMLNIFGAFAQFEREIIRERTFDGLARAKAQGKRLGRRQVLDCGKIIERRASGASYSEIASEFGCSKARIGAIVNKPSGGNPIDAAPLMPEPSSIRSVSCP